MNEVIALRAEEMATMLLTATQEVFTSMLGSDVQQLPEPAPKEHESFDGVLSLIGLTGCLIGNGGFVCSAEAACSLSALMLCAEFPHVDEQVLDSVGEITNMIIGGFKNLLEGQVGRLQMSIPSVICGKNISMRDSKAGITIAVRCAFSGGEFGLTVHLTPARPQ